MGTFVRRGVRRSAPRARPVAIPDDLGRADVSRSSGRVVLPLRVRWSGPPRSYDLADRRDRLLVYEQAMTDATDDDVRAFIDVDERAALRDDLVLPRHVRRARAAWLRQRRGVMLPC
jgi:hypothetical protein